MITNPSPQMNERSIPEAGTTIIALEADDPTLRSEFSPGAKTSLRVLAVLPGPAEGADLIFVRRQIAALRMAGVLVMPFFLASRTSLFALVPEWLRFRRTIREFRPDIVHAHYGTMTGFFSALSTRLPLVITFRGSDLNPSGDVSPLRDRLGRMLSQLAAVRARRIICVSESLKQRLLWGKGRANVIPTGVDLRLFHPCPKDSARQLLGWSSADRVVLFNAGKFPKDKRLDLANQAIAATRSRCGEARLEVLQGATDPATIPILMSAADCLLVASDWEGSPNIVKEALACNLPVVSVDVGDVRERLAGVVPSRIVERSPCRIAEALAEILIRGERSNGRQALRALSLEEVTKQIVSIYHAALGRP